jgi:CHAT domain-containing protein
MIAVLCVGFCPFGLSTAGAQESANRKYGRPTELEAIDPEIRGLLDQTSATCDRSDPNEVVERVQKAAQIADARGLIRDRALAEATLASVYIGQAKIELGFSAFQRALQDAIDSKNAVLEADILVALASEAQLKGKTDQAADLISRALNLAETSGSLYEKAHALGELGKLKLMLGKTDDGVRLIDEALQIDRLNGYRFEAIHLVYRGTYLGLAGKVDEALDSLAQAKTKAISFRDAYTFITAENTYAFGLIQKGRADEAIEDLSLVNEGKLSKFIPDTKEQACLASGLELPVLHLTFLEGFANALDAAKQKDKELEVWLEAYSYSHDRGIPAGEAETAQKVAILSNQLKKTDDALKYFAIAADRFRQLQNESQLEEIQVAEALLLVNANRAKEALPLLDEIAPYARAHHLRQREFSTYLLAAEIYQPAGDLPHAREQLERAQALVQPGPFDSEIENHLLLEAYSRLSDVYRGLQLPQKELIATEKAFVTARHINDDKARATLLTYLDQRLGELRAKELAKQEEQNGQLADSLIYSLIVTTREGSPSKPEDDASSWNRALNLPTKIAQQPGGAQVLTQILAEMGPLLGLERIALLDAISRYYLASNSEPALAERFALESEKLLTTSSGNLVLLKAEIACELAIAYARQSKYPLAKLRLVDCLHLAGETDDKTTKTFAEAADILVQLQIGDVAAARTSLDKLISGAPDNPELHVELAMSLASSKLYEEATYQLDFAVKKFMSMGDKKTSAGAYMRVAIALNSDNSPKAQELQLRYLKEGQRIYHDLGDLPQEAAASNAVGGYYAKLSKGKLAIDHFNGAYELAQKANRDDLAAQALAGLGNAYQAQKDYSKASDCHRRAAEAYSKARFTLQQVISLESLAEDYEAMREPDEALASLLQAKAAAAQIPPLNQYFLDYFLGEFYRRQGRFEKSLGAFHDAVEVTNQVQDVEHCAYAHLGAAGLDGLIGSWEDAVRETEVALDLFQKIGNKQGQASSWAALTGIYSDRSSSLKDFDKARQCYAKAQEFGYGTILQLDLLEVYLQTGKFSEAARIAGESVKSCIKTRDFDCQAHALLSLSEARRQSGEIKAAREALNQARPLASRSLDLYLRGRLLYAEARQLTSEHKLVEALASYKTLITLIETVKGSLDARDQKALSENYGYIYDELVSLLYAMSTSNPREQMGRASEAFEYAEINKARQFAESWGRTFVDQMRGSLSPSVQEKERMLFSKRDKLLADINAPTIAAESVDKNQKSRLEAELAAIENQISAFLQELRKTAPQYAAVAYPETIQMTALPLKKGETLIEFKMTNDATFVWVVANRDGATNELVSFYRLPNTRTWFVDRVSLLRKALNSGHPEAINWKISEEIYQALFPREISSIIAQSQNIIFIPDDALFALPFELFSPSASKGEFVFLKTASTYYPSAVSFRLGRTVTHASTWQEAFFGLADPITSPEDDRFEAANAITTRVTQSAESNGESHDSSSADPSRLKARGFTFERLPGTAIEVRSIATLLLKANEKIEVRIGADATKNKLLDTDLSKFRFVHFATHGVLPVDTNIKEPALVLSYDGVAPSHMFLSMSEILRLKLRSESVVLSACNTGSGSISRAEGVMSLGRAFLAAGASSVTVSLWQVSDESTAVLMEEYYRDVLSGNKKSVALAKARYAVVAKGFKEPFYWAPFIVIGE